jgi:electron transfer flavoprotein alpha subunit
MELDPETKTLKREGVRSEVSAFDVRAVIKAVELRNAHGGEVTALTMGPPQAKEALLECLALGADRAVHLCDRAFAGADTLATARALALALKHEAFDLVLCGRNSTDAETGQVGPEVAELLDLPQITAVRRLSLDGERREVTAEREADDGFETVVGPLPALVTAAEDLAAERFPTKAEREAAKSKPIVEITARSLSADLALLGAAGSPTWVVGLEKVDEKRRGTMIEADTQKAAVDALVERLLEHGLFGTWNVEQRAAGGSNGNHGSRDVDVLVVGEILDGSLRPVTLELVSKAVALSSGSVSVLLAGSGARGSIDQLAAHGAKRVLLLENPLFDSYCTEPYAALLTRVIEDQKPSIVLVPSTAFGRDLAPRVAARLGLGLTGDCIDLCFDGEGKLLQHKPAFGGSIVAPIASRTRPDMATVRPGMLPISSPSHARTAEVIALEPAVTASRVRVLSRQPSAETAPELDRASVVVGVGAGIGGREKLPLFEPLLEALGGAALCTTRNVTDKGWLPKQYQVGLTGRAIAPKLYLAVAVRGAFEHMVGVRRAGLIVAINKNAKAPIFRSADYGLVGDFSECVPLLTERLRSVRPNGAHS